MELIKFLVVFIAVIFLGITQVYYLNKDKKEFYEREELKTHKEKFGRYSNYRGSQFFWSKVLDLYQNLVVPNHIRKTLYVLVIIAIGIQFIPS